VKKADLHVHSLFSAHPSEWFLQRLGTRESYTAPESVYASARSMGMDFITLTDHNQIEGVMLLKDRYPGEVFTGVEITTYFPEDRCKIHVLVYGFTSAQFTEMDSLRNDIYQLRDFIYRHCLAHSVAHATFNINKKLDITHIERLLLLFNYFEAFNGARTKTANTGFTKILQSLHPGHIGDLYRKYRIEPFGEHPWKKGLTGGSDDHAGMFIGETFTSVPSALSSEDFLKKLWEKQSVPGGRHNSFQGLALTIYKIASDFSKNKSVGLPKSLLSMINGLLFDGENLAFKSRFMLNLVKREKTQNHIDFKRRIAALVEEFDRIKHLSSDTKVATVYLRAAEFTDELLTGFLEGIGKNLAAGDINELMRNISGLIPVVFLSLPYITTFNILNESRKLQDSLDESFDCRIDGKNKNILWFTDTLIDLNGPSETIQILARISEENGLQLQPVTCLLPEERTKKLPPGVICLPTLWTYNPAEFSLYTLRFPSILKSLQIINDQQPDEIIISTPGPIGLLGVLAAKLLHVRCRGIFHSDFAGQATQILGDDSVHCMIDDYQRWFYSLCDEIKVPTAEYRGILSKRGYDPGKMSVFRRGIEKEIFKPRDNARTMLEHQYGIPGNGFTLLYAGRISREKRVDFMGELFLRVAEKIPDAALVFCGTGPEPYFTEFRQIMSAHRNVYFLGKLDRCDLPLIYSGSDLFLFPSTTDTFGMVVMEAQACGLPVLVSDVGGPKEIIDDGRTGFVVTAGALEEWLDRIIALHHAMTVCPEQYQAMRSAARHHIINNFCWNRVLADIFDLPPESEIINQSIRDAPVASARAG
jgi:glycosyltransferase involved in cell wall biosynthesis